MEIRQVNFPVGMFFFSPSNAGFGLATIPVIIVASIVAMVMRAQPWSGFGAINDWEYSNKLFLPVDASASLFPLSQKRILQMALLPTRFARTKYRKIRALVFSLETILKT